MRLPKRANRILQHGVRALVVVLRSDVFDLRLREVELGLRQFDYRRKSEIVAALREIAGELRLTHKLHGNRNSLIGRVGRQPGNADVVLDLLLEVAKLLVGGQCLVTGGLLARRKQMAVEDRDVEIDCDSFISFGGDSRILLEIRAGRRRRQPL